MKHYSFKKKRTKIQTFNGALAKLVENDAVLLMLLMMLMWLVMLLKLLLLLVLLVGLVVEGRRLGVAVDAAGRAGSHENYRR